MFYVWEDRVIIAPEGDTRGHEEFISNAAIYEKCVRGYYKKNLIIYTGGDTFNKVDLDKNKKVIKLLIDKLNIPKDVYIYNGVTKGKPGEEWLPMEQVVL